MTTLIFPFLLALSCGSVTDETGGFKLLTLPYATDALEPYISRETVELHHGKHLLTYVNNLNKAVVGTPKASQHLTQIVADSEGAVFNNAGQVLNHNLYFLQFSPTGGGRPQGALAYLYVAHCSKHNAHSIILHPRSSKPLGRQRQLKHFFY